MRSILTCTAAAAFSLAVVTASVVPAGADPLVITNNVNATDLVNALLGPETGITIVDTPTYNGVSNGSNAASGTFTGGAGILPFDSGVLLTTHASASSAAGPNNVGNFGTTSGTGGDVDLTAIVGAVTNDKAVLEFSFTAVGDVISFQYVFGSEEYDEWALSQFNDVFAFFLNGVNIALLPGTSTPVAINNINCGTNSSYYTGNNASGGGTFGSCGNAGLNIQYDGLVGLSIPLFATGSLLPAGEINTLKIAIADVTDSVWDSGVFLKGGSLIDAPPPDTVPVPEPGTLILLGSGLLVGARRAIRRRQA